jgi:collagen type IV alpha
MCFAEGGKGGGMGKSQQLFGSVGGDDGIMPSTPATPSDPTVPIGGVTHIPNDPATGLPMTSAATPPNPAMASVDPAAVPPSPVPLPGSTPASTPASPTATPGGRGGWGGGHSYHPQMQDFIRRIMSQLIGSSWGGHGGQPGGAQPNPLAGFFPPQGGGAGGQPSPLAGIFSLLSGGMGGGFRPQPATGFAPKPPTPGGGLGPDVQPPAPPAPAPAPV